MRVNGTGHGVLHAYQYLAGEKRHEKENVVNGEDELVTTEGIYVTASLEAASGATNPDPGGALPVNVGAHLARPEFQAGPARQRPRGRRVPLLRPASGRSPAQLSSALHSIAGESDRRRATTGGAGCGSHPGTRWQLFLGA